MPDGIVVLGMHRSGTSSVTRVLNLLGASLGAEDDLMRAFDNPSGHWESNELVAVNDRILAAAGGSWQFPPRLAPGWERSAWAEELLPDLSATFDRVYAATDPPWVWKDPRTCLTMPLWRRVIADPVVVLVVRNPRPVARSLQRRNGLRPGYGAALWEHYTRAAIAGSVGLPAVVVRFEDLLADASQGVVELRDRLRDLGAVLDGDLAAAAASVHEATPPSGRAPRLSRRRTRLLRALDELPRASKQLAAPALPAVPYIAERFGTTSLARPYGWSGRYSKRRTAS